MDQEYEYIHDIMRNLATGNDLTFNKDVRLLTSGPSVQPFYDYISNNENMTAFGIVWCTSQWDITPGIAIPCKYAAEDNGKRMIFYSLFYNYSNEDSVFIKPV